MNSVAEARKRLDATDYVFSDWFLSQQKTLACGVMIDTIFCNPTPVQLTANMMFSQLSVGNPGSDWIHWHEHANYEVVGSA